MGKNDSYAEEAKRRWGHTDAYQESERRTAAYTDQDWAEMRQEESAIYATLLDLLANGVAAQDPATAPVADRHREHITKWFYECTPEIHAGLGRMYVEEHRFAATLTEIGAGLAEYLSAVIDSRYGQ